MHVYKENKEHTKQIGELREKLNDYTVVVQMWGQQELGG
jgi:hypothetical protein